MKLNLGEPIPKTQRKTLEEVIEERNRKQDAIEQAMAVRHQQGNEGLKKFLASQSEENGDSASES